MYTVVNSLDDGSAGSLRDALRLVNLGPGGDTINFAPGLKGQSIVLDPSRGTLTLAKAVTITAQGPGGSLTIDGNHAGHRLSFARVLDRTLRSPVRSPACTSGS